MKVITPQLRWTLFGLLCVAGIFNAMDRPVIAGSPGDTDVYGAQQHAPLLDVDIPLNS